MLWLKSVAVAIYVYLLVFVLEILMNEKLSNTFKFSISTGIAIMAYVQMYLKDKNTKE